MTKYVVVFSLCIALCASVAIFEHVSKKTYTVEQLPDGLQTSRVIAHLQKSIFGMGVRIDFPKDHYNSDRVEVRDFLDSKGVSVYDNNGGPTYAMVAGPQDNHKILERMRSILPELSKLMEDLEAGKIKPAKAPEYPLTHEAYVQDLKSHCKKTDWWGMSDSMYNEAGVWIGGSGWDYSCKNGELKVLKAPDYIKPLKHSLDKASE